METYESEFVAPDYTIVDRKIIGNKVITAVIMDGEFIEFEKDLTEQDIAGN
jgi:hypothetical protein